jgi:hypothetical protein
MTPSVRACLFVLRGYLLLMFGLLVVPGVTACRCDSRLRILQRMEGTSIWMKTIKALHTAAHWIRRILEVRMPMAALYGLRIR